MKCVSICAIFFTGQLLGLAAKVYSKIQSLVPIFFSITVNQGINVRIRRKLLQVMEDITSGSRRVGFTCFGLYYVELMSFFETFLSAASFYMVLMNMIDKM